LEKYVVSAFERSNILILLDLLRVDTLHWYFFDFRGIGVGHCRVIGSAGGTGKEAVENRRVGKVWGGK